MVTLTGFFRFSMSMSTGIYKNRAGIPPGFMICAITAKTLKLMAHSRHKLPYHFGVMSLSTTDQNRTRTGF